MSESVRHIFDTNTLISTVLFEHSNPRQTLHHALRRSRELLSLSTFEELADVLQSRLPWIYSLDGN
jgi:hypothetical protein